MPFWSPDTCNCKIEVNNNFNWISTVRTCRLHRTLRGQNLLDTVLAQNRRFNHAFGLDPTDEQFDIMKLSKRVNDLRIKTEPDLRNFDEHLPFEQPLTFFQNLRRVLRLNP